jgi:hypothetical protein
LRQYLQYFLGTPANRCRLQKSTVNAEKRKSLFFTEKNTILLPALTLENKVFSRRPYAKYLALAGWKLLTIRSRCGRTYTISWRKSKRCFKFFALYFESEAHSRCTTNDAYVCCASDRNDIHPYCQGLPLTSNSLFASSESKQAATPYDGRSVVCS